jgi:hypothetical protein
LIRSTNRPAIDCATGAVDFGLSVSIKWRPADRSGGQEAWAEQTKKAGGIPASLSEI